MFSVDEINQVKHVLQSAKASKPWDRDNVEITKHGCDLACDMLDQLIALASNPCLASRLDNEPFFVLLARDPDAPDTLRRWVDIRCTHPWSRANDSSKIEEVQQLSYRFEDWRKDNMGAWRKPMDIDQAIDVLSTDNPAAFLPGSKDQAVRFIRQLHQSHKDLQEVYAATLLEAQQAIANQKRV